MQPGGRSVALALDSYEKEMCARSAIKVLGSRTAAVHLHEPSAMTVGNATRARVAKDASL